MRELLHLRKKNSKEFDLDGKQHRLEISQQLIHYLKNGKWEDIDMTKETSDFMGWERDRYEKNNFKTRLKDSDGSDLTEMACDDGQGGEYWLTIKTAIEKEPVVKVCDIRIERLYKFTADEQIVNPKSTILLDPRLRAEIRNEGVVFIDDEKKKIVFSIRPPKIESDIEIKSSDDLENKYSNEVHFKLTQQDRYILLEKEITQKGLDWIKEHFVGSTKVITIDDTLVLQPGPVVGYDSWINKNAPNANYGTQDGLYSAWWSVNGGEYLRSLLRFDGLISIPPGSTVTSAVLAMREKSGSGTPILTPHRILRDWSESQVTWNSWKTGSAWTTAGAMDVGTDIAAAVDTGTAVHGSFANITVTNTIQNIIDADNNYGFLFVVTKDTGDLNYWEGYSSQYATASLRPKLTVDYTPFSPPNTPSNVLPADVAINQSQNPTLIASAYSDPGSSPHQASQWQISTASGDSFDANIVWDSGADGSNLESIIVNTANGTFQGALAGQTKLAAATTYYWRVRYQNTSDLWSSYSTETSFTTLTPAPPPAGPKCFVPNKLAADGYRCFIQQYVKNKVAGCDPYNLPP